MRCQVGREESVRDALLTRVKALNLEVQIAEVRILTDKVTEIRGGIKQVYDRGSHSGTLLVRMILNDETHRVVRDIPGMGDFISRNPMLPDEVQRILSEVAHVEAVLTRGPSEIRPRHVIFVVMAALLAAPLLGLILASTAGSGADWPSLARLLPTAAISLGAAALAAAAGLPVGLCLALARRRGALLALTLVPLAAPPALAAIEWIALGFPPGRLAASAVLGASLWPVSALWIMSAALRIDASALEAARLHLGRVFLPVVWPRLRRPLAEAFALTLLLAASDFGVAGTFGVPHQAVTILQQLEGHGPRAAVMAALPQIVLGLAVVAALRGWPAPGAPRTGLWLAPAGRRLCWGAAIALWTATAALPAVAVFASARDFGRVLLLHGDGLLLSFGTAAAAAAALTVWACLGLDRKPAPKARRRSAEALRAVFGQGRARAPARLTKLLALNLALPGVLVAYGVLELALRMGVPRDGGVLLALALAARGSLVALLGARAALASVPAASREAARLAGLTPTRAFRVVVLPPALPGLAATACLLLVLGMGDLGAQSLLAPIGVEPAMLTLFNLMHWGYNETVATLAAIHLAAIWAAVLPLAVRR